MKNLLIILSVILTLLVASCASYKKTIYLREAENGDEQVLYEEKKTYKLSVGDILYVEINSLNENLNAIFNIKGSNNVNYNDLYLFLRSYSINDSGSISLPIVGDVKVKGLTVKEAKSEIQKVVDEYLKDATTIVKLVSFKISVLGEVTHPGKFSIYQNKLTVLDALSMAGDISDYGNVKKILLLRTEQERVKTFRFDLTDEDLITKEFFILQPNDVIYVEHIKAKTFRQNAPNLSILLSSITTIVLVLNLILK